MLGAHRIIVDRWAEIWNILEPYADDSFDHWPSEFDPSSVYLVGRVELKQNWQTIVNLVQRYPGRIVFSNPAEGSETMKLQIKRLRITNEIQSGCLGLICSGSIEPGFHAVTTDVYCSNIVTYPENIAAAQNWTEIYSQTQKPYSFLMLNGRLRPHRKYLIDALRQHGLLDTALWTNLNSQVAMPWSSRLSTGESEPVRLLPPDYEIEQARLNQDLSSCQDSFVKHDLFRGLPWGDAVIVPKAYVDTHFSLVTETIFDYPYSFRTEKIWKPIIMRHPFVVASNCGYYRDLHQAGFRTFGHLIDESFDDLPSPQDRANRIVDVVRDICYNGAWEFLTEARSVCEHNYQQLIEHHQQEQRKLPADLERYLDKLTGR